MRSLPYIYLLGALIVPTAVALAHGGVDDGDEVVPPPDPSNRIYVMIGVGVVFALMIGWFVWSKMKAAPAKESAEAPKEPPQTPPAA